MELVFMRGAETLLHLRLERAEICVGSHPTNDVVVPDPTIADVAAILLDRGAGRYKLRDLTGGTVQINGKPLEDDELELSDGDAIGIGPFSLKVKLESDGGSRQRYGQTRLLGAEQTQGKGLLLSHQDQRFELAPGRPFNIGGHEDNELRIQDPFVSSFHCRISHRDGRWNLSDLNSTNGTEVNGLKVREAELPIPATIKIGQVVINIGPAAASTRDERPNVQFHGMVASSESMRTIFGLVSRFAQAKEPVLISGASGSGKELVARAIHDESPRVRAPYLALNCGAFTASLIESELFGHNKGSFTGASHDKPGAFEATEGGSLFLDEIGELPLELQPKLLRVLESSAVRRVGGTKEIPIDVRVIAATHRNLEELVRQGRFRQDLFHRLYVLSLRIPPLSERPEDILPLVRHFIQTQSPVALELTPAAEAALTDYTWPGNVRELRNVVVRTILMRSKDRIDSADLAFNREAFTTRSKDARRTVRQHDDAERESTLAAIEEARGNRAEAARILGVSKSTFHDRLKRLGIPLKSAEKKPGENSSE